MLAWLSAWTVGAETLILIGFVAEFWLDVRQYRAVKRNGVPPALQTLPGLSISEEDVAATRRCQADGKFLDLLDNAIKTGILLIVYQFDVFSRGWNTLARWGVHPYAAVAVFVLVYALAVTALGVPPAYCRVFLVQSRRVAAKPTLSSFVKAMLILFVVQAAGLIVIGFFVQFVMDQRLALLWGWLALAGVHLLAFVVWPAVAGSIAPALGEDPKERAVAESASMLACAVKAEGVRLRKQDCGEQPAQLCGPLPPPTVLISPHLFDVLDTEELMAVLCQQLGAWKLSHALKAVALDFLCSTVLLGITAGALQLPGLTQSAGLHHNAHFMRVFLLWGVRRPFVLVADAARNHLARAQQYETDAFTATQGRSLALITALAKLGNESRDLVAADPLYLLARSPKPQLESRVQRILAHLRREDKS